MDKGLTVPKWVLTVWLKIPQMTQNLSAQFVSPSPKVLDFNEKRPHWASIVCGPSLAQKVATKLWGRFDGKKRQRRATLYNVCTTATY